MHRAMSNVIMMSQNLSAVLQVYELLICQNTESILQNDRYYSIMCLTREPTGRLGLPALAYFVS